MLWTPRKFSAYATVFDNGYRLNISVNAKLCLDMFVIKRYT